MFRRANDQQNQNQNRNPSPEIIEEQKAENGGIGNEALAELIENELNLSVSNEGNNKASANHAGNNGGNEPAEKKEKNNNGPNIRIDEDFVEDLKEIKEDADKEEDKQNEPGMAADAHNKAIEADDIGQADNDMKKADGWDFKAVKIAERKKPGFFRKLGTWAAYYGGKTIGKIGGILGTLFNLLTFGAATKINSWSGIYQGIFSDKDDYQDKRHRSNIPGWDGAKFSKRMNSTDEVKVDFRRIPDVWSYPIAEAAEDAEGKAKDPVISVYISQSSKDMTVDEKGNTGHSGIGIEYSRKSGATGQWQRYNLRYGFFTIGGLPGIANLAVLNYNNATIPGQLRSEKGRSYTVSRSFKANPKQVNDVLKASERWADKGYNAYTRNCTTFAKEMIVDTAHINQAESIFTRDEINLPGKMNLKLFGAGAMAPLFKHEMENAYDKLAHRDDLSYQGYGNKMVTKRDHDRYKSSLKLISFRSTETNDPNGAAENVHRLEGKGTGEIGSLGPVKDNNNDPVKDFTPDRISSLLMNKSLALLALLQEITPEGKLQDGNVPADLNRIIKNLESFYIPFNSLVTKAPDLNFHKSEALTEVRTQLSKEVTDLNTLLFTYYKNDKRLHDPVVETISLIQHAIQQLDEAYQDRLDSELDVPQDDELGKLRSNFSNINYMFTMDGQKGFISPSRYEAYLQAYKTPKAALENFQRFINLKSNRDRTPAEEREFQKLSRINDLTSDFERSHRYMMEKGNYNQQDVDYAFSLENKEKLKEDGDNTLIENEMFTDKGASASTTYQMLILQKIFGGIKNRFKQSGEQNPLDYIQEDLINCIDQKQNEMKMVVRGIKRSMKDPDEKKVRDKVLEKIQNWIVRVMKGSLDKDDILMMNVLFSNIGQELPDKIKAMTQEVMDEDKRPAGRIRRG